MDENQKKMLNDMLREIFSLTIHMIDQQRSFGEFPQCLPGLVAAIVQHETFCDFVDFEKLLHQSVSTLNRSGWLLSQKVMTFQAVLVGMGILDIISLEGTAIAGKLCSHSNGGEYSNNI